MLGRTAGRQYISSLTEYEMTPIILHADHLILMDKNRTVIPNGAVLVGSDGRIQGLSEASGSSTPQITR